MSERALAKVETVEIAPIQELKGWAELAVRAQIIPSSMNAFQAMAIVQAGKEMGLQPLQSLRSMSFIKGRLTMSVQLQLAMAKNKGVTMDDPDESDEHCEVTLHRGKESVTCRYTLADARKAGLISVGGNWDKYPRQMLRWRAIGDALRLIAPDMTMNLLSPEEAASIDPLAPLPVDELKALSATVAPPAPSPPSSGAATGGPKLDSPPASAPPSSIDPNVVDDNEDDVALRDHLFAICAEIAKIEGIEPSAVVYSLTVNASGKFGRNKVDDIPYASRDRKFSPLKAVIRKAEKELERVSKEDGEAV